jgi:hypothetical protein
VSVKQQTFERPNEERVKRSAKSDVRQSEVNPSEATLTLTRQIATGAGIQLEGGGIPDVAGSARAAVWNALETDRGNSVV